MAASATEEQVPLRILVNEEKNKVVFVQAGKDFVDVLLSFLTLPLGTIARIVSKELNMQQDRVGSLSSLYESVANLEEKHFLTQTCKEMLLQPRNSMEACCRMLKLNIDDTEKTKYFICENWDCSRQNGSALLSTFRNKRCRCGKLMNREISHRSSPASASGSVDQIQGFIPEMATFIISDDLKVIPDDSQTSFVLPMNLGCEDFGAIKEITVNVTRKQIVDLLKCSLLSKTPLTDLFLRKKQFPENAETRSTVFNYDIGEPTANAGSHMMMTVKVFLRKSNSKILFALAEDRFVDLLLSFLTFPLGRVEHMLNENSCLGSIDNLYKSIVDLDGDRYLNKVDLAGYGYGSDLKDKLVKSRLAYQFKLYNHILPIDEVSASDWACYSELDSTGRVSGYLAYGRGYNKEYGSSKQEVRAPLSHLEPQSSTGEARGIYGREGFVKTPSLYMVTDDLVVTPSSSISAVSFLTKSKIPPSDLEERVISIGKNEGLSILKASLISSSALTNGLSQLIKPIKEETSQTNNGDDSLW